MKPKSTVDRDTNEAAARTLAERREAHIKRLKAQTDERNKRTALNFTRDERGQIYSDRFGRRINIDSRANGSKPRQVKSKAPLGETTGESK